MDHSQEYDIAERDFWDREHAREAREESAAQWQCTSCSYYNIGGICTHCGTPLTPTETQSSGGDL
jgi:hypothetical protein